MSIRGRIAMGFVGMAMAAPAAWADDPGDGSLPAATTPVAKHTHKGLFGWRHCTECQRARAKAHDGVDIPAPPSLDPGVVPGGMAAGVPCPTCQGTRIIAPGDPNAPGIAVAGGEKTEPGFAVVGGMPGSEPAPVGMSASRPQAFAGMNMTGPRPATGPFDNAVSPASVPPAQVALASPRHERPHVISHLFGLPMVGSMRRAQEDKDRARHAAIAYGSANKPVTEIPASLVYPNGSH